MSEFKVNSYYGEDVNYFDTILASKMAVERVFSHVLFKDDLQRIIYATDDIVFRRRLETIGTGITPHANIVQLQLPFGSCCLAGTPTEDDHLAAAAQVHGFNSMNSNVQIKAQSVKIPFKFTAYFARRDDVDRATQKLYLVKNPNAATWVTMHMTYKGLDLEIPVFVEIDSIDNNPDYKESDWLKDRKIFPIKVSCNIYTYYIKLVDDYDLRFDDTYKHDDDEELVYTERFILDFVSAYGLGHLDSHTRDYNPQSLEEESGPTKRVKKGKPENIRKVETTISQQGIKEVVHGYFADERHCSLTEFYFKDKKIHWKIKESEVAYFNSLSIYVADKINTVVTDSSIEELELPWVQEGSVYTAIMVLSSVDGNKLTYNLTVGDEAIIDIVGDTFTGLRFN